MAAFFNATVPLFIAVFNMSINAVWVIAVLSITRLIFKKAPRAVLCALWVIAAFRLVCPVSFKAVFSLIPSSQAIPLNLGQMQTPAVNSGIGLIDNAVNPLLPKPSAALAVSPLNTFLSVCAFIWLAGIFVMIIYCAVSAVKLRRRIKQAVPFVLPDDYTFLHRIPAVFQCNGIKTAFVIGLFKPCIYLPCNLTKMQTKYIVCHESMHIKRLDYIFKPAAFLILCLHWFNPFVWLAFSLFGRDTEMACDEAVIRTLGNSAKKEYSSALLSLATGQHAFAGSPLAFGEGTVKGRIKNVLRYKKPTFMFIILSAVVLIVISVCLLANPVENTDGGADLTPDLSESQALSESAADDTALDSSPNPEIITAGQNGRVRVMFPAYQGGRNEYNAAVYDTPLFDAFFNLPEGWSLSAPDDMTAATPWTPMNIYNADGVLVGTVGFGIFEDMPELSAEEFYKSAFAELRLSSMVAWCVDYTPIITADNYQTATSKCLVSNAFFEPDDYSGNTADAETIEYPAVTVWDRDMLVYVAMEFLPGSITDEQLTAVAESLILQGGAQANG